MQDIRNKFTSVKEQVEKKVYDSYLLQYIKKPIIDEDKLLFLISIMDKLELSFNQLKNYALSTMFIQIALDTHEHISNTLKEERSRQLTVLAGDYYSGLYYKLLSEMEDIKLIKQLSIGIKEVNENKIDLYHKDLMSTDELMTSLKLIECSLLSRFSHFFNVELWNDFVGNLFLFKRLMSEKKQYMQSETSILFEAMKEVIFPEKDKNELSINDQETLVKTCDDYLEKTKQLVEEGLKQLPYLNGFLEERVMALLDQYKPYVKSFVEEG